MAQDERIYLELQLSQKVEEDINGNYIIKAEASNENVDVDGQIVLQNALVKSKDYFMKNGIISWDHLHKQKDANGNIVTNPEFIIGEPLGIETEGDKTFVKAILYKGNKIVEDIVDKLRQGAKIIKTSVGGRKPVVQKSYDKNTGKNLEKIVDVNWDELALTYKPCNQTLSPVQLIKSLQAGYPVDSANMSGGETLVKQDLEGADKAEHIKRHAAMKALIMAMAEGNCNDIDTAHNLLVQHGIQDEKVADSIIESVVNGRNKLEGVSKMAKENENEDLGKALDTAIDELEKACNLKKGMAKNPPRAEVPEAPEDENSEDEENESEEEPEEEEEDKKDKKKKKHPEPDADNFGGESDEDEDNGVKKSLNDFEDIEEDFVDVSPVLTELTKSINNLGKMMSGLSKRLDAYDGLSKSMANAQLQTAKMVKSISDEPVMRKGIVDRMGRQFVETNKDGKKIEMSRDEILRKSHLAVEQGKLDIHAASVMEDRINKGIPISDGTIEMLKSIQ
jgi:hypothetical protein